MATLTKLQKQKIRDNLIEYAFKKRTDEIVKTEHNLALELYRKIYSHDMEKRMSEFPAGYFNTAVCIHCYVDGSYLRLDLPSSKPVAYDLDSDQRKFSSGTPFGSACHAFMIAHKKYEEDKYVASKQIGAVLDSVRTIKRLLEIWPEAESFTTDIQPVVKVNALAKPISSLNELLGLPPDKTK